MEVIGDPKGGIGNKAKRLDFQNAEERQDASDGETGARGGLTADEFQFKRSEKEDYEDFA